MRRAAKSGPILSKKGLANQGRRVAASHMPTPGPANDAGRCSGGGCAHRRGQGTGRPLSLGVRRPSNLLVSHYIGYCRRTRLPLQEAVLMVLRARNRAFAIFVQLSEATGCLMCAMIAPFKAG